VIGHVVSALGMQIGQVRNLARHSTRC
jgi:hypothetical protein